MIELAAVVVVDNRMRSDDDSSLGLVDFELFVFDGARKRVGVRCEDEGEYGLKNRMWLAAELRVIL